MWLICHFLIIFFPFVILNLGKIFAFFSLLILIHMAMQESFISPGLKHVIIQLSLNNVGIRCINIPENLHITFDFPKTLSPLSLGVVGIKVGRIDLRTLVHTKIWGCSSIRWHRTVLSYPSAFTCSQLLSENMFWIRGWLNPRMQTQRYWGSTWYLLGGKILKLMFFKG